MARSAQLPSLSHSIASDHPIPQLALHALLCVFRFPTQCDCLKTEVCSRVAALTRSKIRPFVLLDRYERHEATTLA